MNNNNRNNRRRGRGNRNQGGNGSQLNRIDSRARGNAPQMLDKYKKLAQDAHHNGDRVQMEYYLQFADHYFRVIADNKARMDEARGARRPDEREQTEDYGDDDLDFDRGRRNEPSTRSRYEQQDADRSADRNEGEPGQEGESFLNDDRSDDRAGDQGDSPPRQQNTRRQPRQPRDDARGDRNERPARTEKRADKPSEKTADKPAPRARKPRKAPADDRSVIDSSILPPSIRGDDAGSGPGDSDGTLEAVG